MVPVHKRVTSYIAPSVQEIRTASQAARSTPGRLGLLQLPRGKGRHSPRNSFLQPRLAHLVRFTCPVDALHLQSDTSFTSELLAVLPNSLTELELQTFLTDIWFWEKLQETQGLPLNLSSACFLALQDTAPHLSALRRLSSLRSLSLPVHATLHKCDLESLAAIRDLQGLEVTFRDSVSQADSPFLAPDASFSILAPLTSLTMAGSRICHLAGAAQLSRLMRLSVTGTTSLSLHGVQQSAALKHLRLTNVHLSQSGLAMLQTLHTLKTLESLALGHVTFPSSASILRFATLWELSTLKSLDVRRCGSLSYDWADDEGRNISMLTQFIFEIVSTTDREGLAAPGLNQLRYLSKVHLVSCKMAPDVIPDTLGSLLFLSDLLIVIWGRDAPAAPAKPIDISALALLGPNIAEITIRGRVQLLARCSLLQLAAQPRLHSFRVFEHLDEAKPRISTDATSWLHCAALFHALLNRPHKRLPAVSLMPDLSRL